MSEIDKNNPRCPGCGSIVEINIRGHVLYLSCSKCVHESEAADASLTEVLA